MITLNSVFFNMCLKLCILTVSLHNSASQILYLIAAGSNFFELYPANLNLTLCSCYKAAPHATPLVSKTRVKCPLLFDMMSTGGLYMSFFISSKVF